MLGKEDRASQFLRDLPFFKGLDGADLQAFLGAAFVRDYPKNTAIFHQGDKADRLFTVMSGWVKLFRNTEDGDEAVVTLFARNDIFGEAAMFTDAGYPFSAQAAEDARLIEIPASLIRERARANPDIMARVMSAMLHEIHKLQVENEHLAIMSAPQRVGCLLLQLSAGMAGRGAHFHSLTINHSPQPG